MQLFEMSVKVNGWVERVQVTARDDRAAYTMFCRLYGEENVMGWPSLLG